MALFSECSLKCARKVLDTADIVREGDLSTGMTVRRTLTPGTVDDSDNTEGS